MSQVLNLLWFVAAQKALYGITARVCDWEVMGLQLVVPLAALEGSACFLQNTVVELNTHSTALALF